MGEDLHSLGMLGVPQVQVVDREDGISDEQPLTPVCWLTLMNLWYKDRHTMLLSSLQQSTTWWASYMSQRDLMQINWTIPPVSTILTNWCVKICNCSLFVINYISTRSRSQSVYIYNVNLHTWQCLLRHLYIRYSINIKASSWYLPKKVIFYFFMVFRADQHQYQSNIPHDQYIAWFWVYIT